MNVDDMVTVSVDYGDGEFLHVSGEEDKVDFKPLERPKKSGVKLHIAPKLWSADVQGGDAMFARDFESARAGVIADDTADACVGNPPLSDSIEYGANIRAPS